MAASDPAPRRPGRPRSPKADAAILQATLTLLLESGFEGMSVDAVAARAGVGKATIYRRWATKEALVVAVLQRTAGMVRVPDTGSVRTDLLAIVADIVRIMNTSGIAGALPRLLASVLSNPTFTEAWWQTVVAPRRAAIVALVERGKVRGEVRAGADSDLLTDMVTGPLILHALFGAMIGRPTPEILRGVVETLWIGMAAE